MSKASSVVSRNSLGKEFHSLGVGPSTENARKPHEFRRYDELMSSVDDVSVTS